MKKIEKIANRMTFPMMTVQEGLTSIQTQVIELQSKMNEVIDAINELSEEK